MESEEVWNVKVVIIPVVIGALGTMLKKIHHYIKQIDIPIGIVSIQKIAIRNSLYHTKSVRHLRNWVDFRCLV